MDIQVTTRGCTTTVKITNPSKKFVEFIREIGYQKEERRKEILARIDTAKEIVVK